MSVPEREAENRRLLDAAGYAWDEDAKCWARGGRILNGELARTMPLDALKTWIKDGGDRPASRGFLTGPLGGASIIRERKSRQGRVVAEPIRMLDQLDPRARRMLKEAGYNWDPSLNAFFHRAKGRAIAFKTVCDRSLEWLEDWLKA